MTTSRISLGKFEIYGLRDGFFSLDGGAMFGVVPKVLWQRKYPADSENRIKLGLNCLLVVTEEARVLIDTGIGPYLSPQHYNYYSVDRDPDLVSNLQTLGFSVNDIDFVINTHLHFDHCGGNISKNEQGELVPTFPNARYIIQKCEWETGLSPPNRDKPSYLKQLFLPLEAAGSLDLVEGDKEVVKGVEVVLAPGHTAHHQCIKVESEDSTLFFLGDMVPTSAHVSLPYIMSYDLFPMLTFQNKEKYFDQAIAEQWIVAFNHDPELFFGRISKKQSKYYFVPWEQPLLKGGGGLAL